MTEWSRKRRLLVGIPIAIGVIAIVVGLAVFIPKKTKRNSEAATTGTLNPPSLVTHQVNEDDSSAPYFFIPKGQPLESTTPSNILTEMLEDAVPPMAPSKGGIAVGAQVEVNLVDIPLCTVATPGALLDFIRNVPECQTIYLADLVTYLMPETMYISRPITIVGNPLALPTLIPLTIPHLFRVVGGGSLDLRFVQVTIMGFSLAPTFNGGLAVTISGSVVYVQEGGEAHVLGCSIAAPTLPEWMLDLSAATGMLRLIMLRGSMFYFEGGDNTVTACSFTVILSYVPADFAVTCGGLFLQIGGSLTVTGASVTLAVNNAALSGVGSLIAMFGGVLNINGFALNIGVGWASMNACGWGFFQAGGITIITGMEVAVGVVGVYASGAGFITNHGGVIVDVGASYQVSIMFMTSYSLGQAFHQGSGVLIRVGASMWACQGYVFFAGLGEVLFLGSGYYLEVGVVAGATSLGRVAAGLGIYEFIGSGMVQVVGFAGTVFDVFTVVGGLGIFCFLGAGYMNIVGGAVAVTIVMGGIFGLGAVGFVTVGRLEVVGFLISIFWMLAAANPCIAEIFYVGGPEQWDAYYMRIKIIVTLVLTGKFIGQGSAVAYGCDFALVGLPDLEEYIMANLPDIVSALAPLLFLGVYAVPKIGIALINCVISIGNPAALGPALQNLWQALLASRLSNFVVYFADQTDWANTVQINIPLGGPGPGQRELLTLPKPEESLALPACQICNVPNATVSGTSADQCTISQTCPQQEEELLTIESFTSCTIFRADFIFTCNLAENETSCSTMKQIQAALDGILGFPQVGAYLTISNSSFAYDYDLVKHPPTTPIPDGEGSLCQNQTTYEVYATGADQKHIDSIRDLFVNLTWGEASSMNVLFMQINQTQPLCGVIVKNIKDYIAPFVKTHRPRRAHAFEGRMLKEVRAPRVMVTEYNCSDHTILKEVIAGEKITVWLEGFPSESDLIVQIMGFDDDLGVQEGQVMANLQKYDASQGPIEWAGRISSRQPPGMYYLKVYRALEPAIGYMYSQAFTVLENPDRPSSRKTGASNKESILSRTRSAQASKAGEGFVDGYV